LGRKKQDEKAEHRFWEDRGIALGRGRGGKREKGGKAKGNQGTGEKEKNRPAVIKRGQKSTERGEDPEMQSGGKKNGVKGRFRQLPNVVRVMKVENCGPWRRGKGAIAGGKIV